MVNHSRVRLVGAFALILFATKKHTHAVIYREP